MNLLQEYLFAYGSSDFINEPYFWPILLGIAFILFLFGKGPLSK